MFCGTFSITFNSGFLCGFREHDDVVVAVILFFRQCFRLFSQSGACSRGFRIPERAFSGAVLSSNPLCSWDLSFRLRNLRLPSL